MVSTIQQANSVTCEVIFAEHITSVKCPLALRKVSVSDMIPAMLGVLANKVSADFPPMHLDPTKVIVAIHPQEVKESLLSDLEAGFEFKLFAMPAGDHPSVVSHHINSLKDQSALLPQGQAFFDDLRLVVATITEKINDLATTVATNDKKYRQDTEKYRQDIDNMKKTFEQHIVEQTMKFALLELDLGNKNDELVKENEDLKKHIAELDCRIGENLNLIIELTLASSPLHLRVLLDNTRKKVLEVLQCDTWEELRGERTAAHLQLFLQSQSSLCSLPGESIKFLCTYNNVRKEGNTAAHFATKEQIKDAVSRKPIGSNERKAMEGCIAFLFAESV